MIFSSGGEVTEIETVVVNKENFYPRQDSERVIKQKRIIEIK